MPERTFLYHREYAPEGRIFDLEKVSARDLAEQGWVDHPGKIRVNLWSDGKLEEVEQIADAFERGEIPPIGGTTTLISEEAAENKRLAEIERQRLYSDIRAQQDEIDQLREEIKRRKELHADLKSDSAKQVEKIPETQVAVTDTPKRGRPKKDPRTVRMREEIMETEL